MATSNRRSRPNQTHDGLKSVMHEALHEFAELSGQRPEQVSGVRHSEEGWSILVDVVDLERVPSTTSIMSTYRVDVDSAGHLLGYERIRRFTRASTDSH